MRGIKLALILSLLLTATPTLGQAPRPDPLPRLGPGLSDLGQANRLKRAGEDAQFVVARALVRFNRGGVTSSLIKRNPYGFKWNVESDGARWKRYANAMKPVKAEARPGYLHPTSPAVISGQKKNATCHIDDFGPGFHEILFLRGSDTTDKEQDNFICRIRFLPIPTEDLEIWIGSLPLETADAFNACAEASNNTINNQFWQCAETADIPFPELTQDMTKRVKKGPA